MTFSLVARCAETGMTGMVISSSSPAVAARCAHGRAGVGTVASQNITDPRLGPQVLDLMAGGMSVSGAVAQALSQTRHGAYRQVLAVSVAGETSVHSGPQALGIWSSAQGRDCAAGGNLLARAEVPQAMVSGFEAAPGAFGDRLIAALCAGRDAGGEAGPVHSAGLAIFDKEAWPWAELRCDWSESCPIAAVSLAWEVYAPQAQAYVTRALNPTEAPSYGVPGDP